MYQVTRKCQPTVCQPNIHVLWSCPPRLAQLWP